MSTLNPPAVVEAMRLTLPRSKILDGNHTRGSTAAMRRIVDYLFLFSSAGVISGAVLAPAVSQQTLESRTLSATGSGDSLVAAGVPEGVRAAAEQGLLSFTDITASGGLGDVTTGSHGVMFGDADGDGRPDIYVTYNMVTSGLRANRFFRNTGGGSFVEEAVSRGIANVSAGAHGAAWVDLDNDGDFDLVNGNTTSNVGSLPPESYIPAPNRVFVNDGGTFSDRTPPAIAGYAGFTRAFFASDFDRDGDLDIFGINGDKGTADTPPDTNEAYRNDGDGTYSAVSAGAFATAPAGQGATDSDFDGDGDVDIIAGNRFGDLCILRNVGTGSFMLVSPGAIGIVHRASTGVTTADLDNDGDFDLVLMDQDLRGSFMRVAHVYRNNGDGRFQHMGSLERVGGYTAGTADFDNDGDLDLVFPGFPNVIVNHGQWRFAVGPPFPGPELGPLDPRSIALADVDGDGDIDAVASAKSGGLSLVRNDFNAGRWLKVRLTTSHGQAGAFGAKVRVTIPGTDQFLAVREVKSATGYLAQDDPVLHFGLGSRTTVDVHVTFADGSVATRADVAANQTLSIRGSAGPSRAPGAPQNLAASVVDREVSLVWGAPLVGATPSAYLLRVGSVPGAADVTSLTVNGNTRSFAATAPPGTYYVRVWAQNAFGIGPPSNEIAVVTGGCQAPPRPPVGLASSVAGSQVTLTWSHAAGGSTASSYLLEAGTGPAQTNVGVFNLTGTPSSYSASGVPNGVYYVRLRARNDCGTGAASNEVVISVPQP